MPMSILFLLFSSSVHLYICTLAYAFVALVDKCAKTLCQSI